MAVGPVGNGRIQDLALERLKDSRRVKPAEKAVTALEASSLDAFVESQDAARQADAVRKRRPGGWLRARISQLDVIFLGLVVASTLLFVVASFRSAIAGADGFGFGLLTIAFGAALLSAAASMWASSTTESRLWTVSLATLTLGIVVGLAVAPQFA